MRRPTATDFGGGVLLIAMALGFAWLIVRLYFNELTG